MQGVPDIDFHDHDCSVCAPRTVSLDKAVAYAKKRGRGAPTWTMVRSLSTDQAEQVSPRTIS